MSKNRIISLIVAIILFNAVGVFAATLEENWNDFLHYTAIGRFELAKGYADAIIASDPDPVELLKLSEENERGYGILVKVYNNSDELKDVAGKLMEIIEQGRYERRIDPAIITGELKRLSSTVRGRIKAEQRLKNAGEYAIPYFLDALMDSSRKSEYPYISAALGKMGRDAIRPLCSSLQMSDVAVKADVIRALGSIGYEQSLPYLKYICENSSNADLQDLAVQSIKSIDPAALKIPSAKLFYSLADKYYYHEDSVSPNADYNFANVWFWDVQSNRLKREQVSKSYFNELMSMRCSEWSLKADADTPESIALWIAAYFKAEKPGEDMPDYFGEGHADAMTYAITAGPEYLHRALARALKDNNDYVALNVVEALATNAGESSLLYRFGTEQPLVKALSYDDLAVKYSAAIAIGGAGPSESFMGSSLIIGNLSDALVGKGSDELGADLSNEYSYRAMDVLTGLAVSGNEIIDIACAKSALIKVLNGSDDVLRVEAAKVLSYLESPDAQRAIADAAMNDDYSLDVKLSLFESLIGSAKKNGQLLTESQIDAIYALTSSKDADVQLRAAAAGAYGSLNLPSKKVKDLILDQSKS